MVILNNKRFYLRSQWKQRMLKLRSDSTAFYFPVLDKNPLNISFALLSDIPLFLAYRTNSGKR